MKFFIAVLFFLFEVAQAQVRMSGWRPAAVESASMTTVTNSKILDTLANSSA